MYEIEKNIEIPSNKHQKYPWDDLEVGDSFLMPDGNLNQARSASNSWAMRHNVEFAVRTVDGGVRVWRIA